MITTVQQHILQQQQEISEASGRFSWLLSGITLATKMAWVISGPFEHITFVVILINIQ